MKDLRAVAQWNHQHPDVARADKLRLPGELGFDFDRAHRRKDVLATSKHLARLWPLHDHLVIDQGCQRGKFTSFRAPKNRSTRSRLTWSSSAMSSGCSSVPCGIGPVF